jgi:BA14K-like protein
MNKRKILTTAIAAVLISWVGTPVLAQDAGVIGPGSREGGLTPPYVPGGIFSFVAAGGAAQSGISSYADSAPATDEAYCARHYRSYDPSSGTFFGHDGIRHPCR